MDQTIVELRTSLLEQWFDAANAQTVTNWLIAAEGRRPIVLIGAGFTRNAKHRYRKGYARSEEVPLWWHVIERMAVHLGVRPDRYDAPTMAEMYASSFGESDLRDLLRSTLPDEDLLPGDAHAALRNYDAAAIITTNCLDTLLDKSSNAGPGRWNRVVADADLSASTKTTTSTTDIIYFHGHRSSSDTWIMTRSQYEDVSRTRPVMVARVRQLLAQHPFLILGFGLSDPNFHNIYRQVSREMRQHQPLGLAIQLGEVSEAERRHWDKLGIRIAVPRDAGRFCADPAASDAFFAALFPSIRTSWSPDEESVRKHLFGVGDYEQRVRRFHGLIRHEWNTAEKLTYSEIQGRIFDLWSRVTFGILSAADQSKADQIANDEFRRHTSRFFDLANTSRSTPAAPQDAESKSTFFNALPVYPGLLKTNCWAWRLDAVLVRLRSPQTQLALSEHFEAALRHDLFDTAHAEQYQLPWTALTFWLAARVSDGASARIRVLAQDCLRHAARYEDHDAISFIQAELGRLQIHLDTTPASHGLERPTKSDSPERQAFYASLDSDWDAARAYYRIAADGAEAAGDAFSEWVWRIGELGALRAKSNIATDSEGGDHQGNANLEQEVRACRNRVRTLERVPKVESWLNRARERSHRLLVEALEERHSRDWSAATGGTSMHFSTAFLMAWRSFRDLETISAPPWLQREYLEPLLWQSSFRPGTELAYRLRLDSSKTGEWLRLVFDTSVGTLEQQRERDAELMEAFLAQPPRDGSRSDVMARVVALPSISQAIRTDDIRSMWLWLADARKYLGLTSANFQSERRLYSDYARAFSTVASFGKAWDARELYKEWRKDVRRIEREELARAVYALPWHNWSFTDRSELPQWLELMLEEAMTGGSHVESGLPQHGQSNRDDIDAEEYRAFTIFTLVSYIKERSPEAIGDEVRKRLEGYLSRLMRVPMNGSTGDELRRAAFLLERLLRDSDSRLAHERRG